MNLEVVAAFLISNYKTISMKPRVVLPILLISVIVISGCVEEQEPVTEIYVPGHGNQIYAFHNDIRESLKVPVNNPEGIKALAAVSNGMYLVFDGSNPQDNAYFTIVTTEITQKISTYYSYEGRLFGFMPYYHIGSQWYDSGGKEINKPDFSGPVMWLLGPSTGANDTSVTLVNSTVYISGTSYNNLTLAGDKFVLLIFGIDRV
ncbi:MAG: seg [archaeon GW2011_AR5]|nr:MAG: seg [archaeon GW2011_AR5]